jgi:hypothetical protein
MPGLELRTTQPVVQLLYRLHYPIIIGIRMLMKLHSRLNIVSMENIFTQYQQAACCEGHRNTMQFPHAVKVGRKSCKQIGYNA